jgi:Flp pilus assembly protein TadG
MSRSSLALSRKSRRGVAAVEFALLLPFLCFMLIVTVDFCRVYYYSLTISNCARNGALYGSADSAHAQNSSGIVAAAQKDASNLNLEHLGVGIATDSSSYVSVTVTYPFTTITKYLGIPNQITLTRTVRMNILPATPAFN